jgi:hypothetical protein
LLFLLTFAHPFGLRAESANLLVWRDLDSSRIRRNVIWERRLALGSERDGAVRGENELLGGEVGWESWVRPKGRTVSKVAAVSPG